MMIPLVFLLLSSSIVTASPTPKPSSSAPSVTTSQGTFVGKSANSIDDFLGIPFAEPPVGDRRFSSPVLNRKNLGTFDASNYGYICPQLGNNTNVASFPPTRRSLSNSSSITARPPLPAESEDCLTLNIQRPSGVKADAKLPVMFWIYGGAFETGSSPQYDASLIVGQSIQQGQPIIFVSVNYRLNAFGFLPGKESANDKTVSVNAGLEDQRLALYWVNQHISAFGGDPSKVTIAGESAGAISVGFQMLVNGGSTDGLFRAAIMESGSPLPFLPTSHGQPSFDTVAAAVGCTGAKDAIACLRAVPYEKLHTAINTISGITGPRSINLAFSPRVDGRFLSEISTDAINKGRYAHVPIISGDEEDEGTILTTGTYAVQTNADFEKFVATVIAPGATAAQQQEIIKLYPDNPALGSPFGTGTNNSITPQSKRISALVGDLTFQAPRRFFLAATRNTQPTYSYLSRTGFGKSVFGTFHGTDVLQLFGQVNEVSIELRSRWISFITTLDPNNKGYVKWPLYGSSKKMLLFAANGSSIIHDTYRKKPIAYLASIQRSLAT